MTLLMRVSLFLCLSLSLCVLCLCLCLSLSVSVHVYPRSGRTGRWRLPCSTHLSPAVSLGVRVLEAWDVVVLVAVDIAVVGLFFLLLIFVVLLFTEPSIDAIVACCRRRYVGSPSLSVSSQTSSLLCSSICSLLGRPCSRRWCKPCSVSVSGSFSASLSLAVFASASVAVLASISRPCCLCLCHCLCLCL